MYYYIEYLVLLVRGTIWQVRDYGYEINGKGDCLTRTSLLAIALSKVNPELSQKLLVKCWDLLRKGIRWPEELNHEHVKGKKKFRSPKSMTRDPYITTACATDIITGGLNIHVIPKLWLRRRYLTNWIRYRFTGDDRYVRRFEALVSQLLRWGESTKKVREFVDTFHIGNTFPLRWTRPVFGIHGYSLHLWSWLAYVAKAENLQKRLLEYVPKWNLLLRLLCGDFVSESEVEAYISTEGYQWDSEYWRIKEPIPENETYHLDKDILEFVWNEQNTTNL